MEFLSPLIRGKLRKRYKRFLADVELETGDVVVAHCPNTGAMTGCAEPGFEVWLRPANDPKRKLQFTWELAVNGQGHFIGINSAYANNIVAEAIDNKQICELRHYQQYRREVSFGNEKSKVDFLLQDEHRGVMYLEVKSVTLLENGVGFFPDTVTTRGQKHLRELTAIKSSGIEAGILFCVQHTGIEKVSIAEHLDAEYGRLMREARAQGLTVLCYKCKITPSGIQLAHSLPFEFQ